MHQGSKGNNGNEEKIKHAAFRCSLCDTIHCNLGYLASAHLAANPHFCLRLTTNFNSIAKNFKATKQRYDSWL